ncbi:MAG: 50S ribosomal protein L19e [Candidatus Nanoarchaeia archaeon]|nr:50S ribosomal protein L19e [Candidatus Nanoarchaeia archaeon]
MDLFNQKELAARTFKVGKKRIKLNPDKQDKLKDAITRFDLRKLKGTAITVKNKKGVSTVRANKLKEQKKKGRKKGAGNKKGPKYSRISRKQLWINKVRTQRKLLKELKDKSILSKEIYRKIYNMISGGFFRSRAHLKLYITTRLEK